MLEGGQKPSYLGQSLTNGLTNEIANIGSQTFTMNIGDWILLKNRLIFSSLNEITKSSLLMHNKRKLYYSLVRPLKAAGIIPPIGL